MILLGMRTLRDQKVTLFVDHDKQSLIMYIDDDTKLVLTSMEEIAKLQVPLHRSNGHSERRQNK